MKAFPNMKIINKVMIKSNHIYIFVYKVNPNG